MVLIFLSSEGISQDTTKTRGIIPDYLNMQFAGNIGAASIGIGYYLNPIRSLSFDMIYGYSPSNLTNVDIHNIIIRLNYKPTTINLPKKWSMKPIFNMAISMHLIDDNSIFKKLPSIYPKGHYAPNAFRFHFDFGGILRYDFTQHTFFKAVELYVTSTTNDLYLYSIFKAKRMAITDIFSIAIGLNIFLFH